MVWHTFFEFLSYLYHSFTFSLSHLPPLQSSLPLSLTLNISYLNSSKCFSSDSLIFSCSKTSLAFKSSNDGGFLTSLLVMNSLEEEGKGKKRKMRMLSCISKLLHVIIVYITIHDTLWHHTNVTDPMYMKNSKVHTHTHTHTGTVHTCMVIIKLIHDKPLNHINSHSPQISSPKHKFSPIWLSPTPLASKPLQATPTGLVSLAADYMVKRENLQEHLHK